MKPFIIPIEVSNNKKPVSFYSEIQVIAEKYHFEVFSDHNTNMIIYEIRNMISTHFPRVTSIDEISITPNNAAPSILIGKAIIQEMEIHYPEAMV